MHGNIRIALLAILSLIRRSRAQIVLVVDTPTSARQCEPFDVIWNGGVTPYILSILPEAGDAIATFTNISGEEQDWVVNGTVGDSLVFHVEDGNGVVGSSHVFKVVAGKGIGCIVQASPSSTVPAGTVSHTSLSSSHPISGSNVPSTTPTPSPSPSNTSSTTPDPTTIATSPRHKPPSLQS
ncbi:hypothetical protein FB45DRAFT_1080752 [Roridomyces roridus]|uniref:Extracellular matrix protein n=1 Tax=Roridomyces roridus TaxID=1738132 RepID=A0AAD7BSP4_9AGAR|nr:hypothetical protein FB45DRAFT_1080752 [Roridomyces roridus]